MRDRRAIEWVELGIQTLRTHTEGRKRTAGGPRKRGCHFNTPTCSYRSEPSLASA